MDAYVYCNNGCFFGIIFFKINKEFTMFEIGNALIISLINNIFINLLFGSSYLLAMYILKIDVKR